MLEEDMDQPNAHTEQELDTAYSAGYNASHDDKGMTTNPYPLDSILWQQWRAGWQHYDADYNPDYYSLSYFDDL